MERGVEINVIFQIHQQLAQYIPAKVDRFAQRDGLANGIAIARPQLNGLRSAPPLDAKDTMLRLLSTFPQWRCLKRALSFLFYTL